MSHFSADVVMNFRRIYKEFQLTLCMCRELQVTSSRTPECLHVCSTAVTMSLCRSPHVLADLHRPPDVMSTLSDMSTCGGGRFRTPDVFSYFCTDVLQMCKGSFQVFPQTVFVYPEDVQCVYKVPRSPDVLTHLFRCERTDPSASTGTSFTPVHTCSFVLTCCFFH